MPQSHSAARAARLRAALGQHYAGAGISVRVVGAGPGVELAWEDGPPIAAVRAVGALVSASRLRLVRRASVEAMVSLVLAHSSGPSVPGAAQLMALHRGASYAPGGPALGRRGALVARLARASLAAAGGAREPAWAVSREYRAVAGDPDEVIEVLLVLVGDPAPGLSRAQLGEMARASLR